MVAQSPITAFGQQIHFQAYKARAIDVQSWSASETRSEGGGGYVHPQYGGYLHAPTVITTTSHYIRARLQWPDGRQETLDLPGAVQLSKGDAVSLLAASNADAKRWGWVGLVNHTTERQYKLGEVQHIAAFRPADMTQYSGKVFYSLFAGGGVGVATVGTGLLMLVASLGLSSVFEAFHRATHSCRLDYFNIASCDFDVSRYLRISALIVVAVSVIGIFRATTAAHAASAAFDGARQSALLEALRRGQGTSEPG